MRLPVSFFSLLLYTISLRMGKEEVNFKNLIPLNNKKLPFNSPKIDLSFNENLAVLFTSVILTLYIFIPRNTKPISFGSHNVKKSVDI